MATADEYKKKLEALIKEAEVDGFDFWAEAEVYASGSCCRTEIDLEGISLTFSNGRQHGVEYDYATIDESLYFNGRS